MKKANPQKLARFLTFIFLISVLIISFILQLIFLKEIYFIYSLLLVILNYPIFYYVTLRIIKKYIYDRINLIYKTIYHSKTNISDIKNGKNSKNQDVIDAVSQEVQDWAIKHEKEIAEYKRMEAYRREFLGNVSHELKTPITTIQGYVLTLLDGGLNDPKINKKYLLRTAKNINRLITIVNDLETISKLEAGVLQLEETRFNIVMLIRDVIELMEMKAQKRNINLTLNVEPDEVVYVIADKNKIRQVLINLIDNSLKYGKDGGKTEISLFDMDDHILVEVSDDGIGIDEADLPRIFERFYRTEKSRARSQGGTGLGLAIVKHIIEAHKQTINVRSKPNEGSTFGFTLLKG